MARKQSAKAAAVETEAEADVPPETPEHLILNSPYAEPQQYWFYDAEERQFRTELGRRPAGYMVSSETAAFDDPGQFIEIPLVNDLRPLVKAWREAGHPGATGATRALLEHWRSPERAQSFFFCQLEALETLIWLTEAPERERARIEVPSDGGEFQRLCAKMATGSGKTVVMAMLIAWQVLNHSVNPRDKRFSRCVFIVAPGLTVKDRLQVLKPENENNYYARFDIVPAGYLERLRRGVVLINNWHTLGWDTEERIQRRRSVDKRGAKSDEAYVREILQGHATERNWLVLNDEAHHAWRVPAAGQVKLSREEKKAAEEATKWVGALDRLHSARGILACYDFSATPYAPTGEKSRDVKLFDWIVSDFGLNDAIESGIVKTPRIVVNTNALPNAADLKPKLYHIYRHVKESLNGKRPPEEPLPGLVTQAYQLLAADWLEWFKQWEKDGAPTPPVMISVCNRTETAARVHYAFERKQISHLPPELCEADKLLHIDSKVLGKAEEQQTAVDLSAKLDADDEDDGAEDVDDSDSAPAAKKYTAAEYAEYMRRLVDTVGKPGQPGADIRHVISVDMLSEGWDTQTVTHIMGLRAFTSQLLCEQVIGRGLRRTSYDINPDTGLFDPEYVNIFGVPFTFLPHESETSPKPARHVAGNALIRVEPEKQRYEIRWPNVARIEPVFQTRLQADWNRAHQLSLNAKDTVLSAELAPVVDGKANLDNLTEIEFSTLMEEMRMQSLLFDAAGKVFQNMRAQWPGDPRKLMGQLVRLTEEYLESGRIEIIPQAYARDEGKRRAMLALNLTSIVQHLLTILRLQNAESLRLVFHERALGRTGEMPPWYTKKRHYAAKKSHINLVVCDSADEANAARSMDKHKMVDAFAKNDHLGFEIGYMFQGRAHKYRPDYLIRLNTGVHLILEIKGRDDEQQRAKRDALEEWTRAVNQDGRFGLWTHDVSFDPGDIIDKIEEAGRLTVEQVYSPREWRDAREAG